MSTVFNNAVNGIIDNFATWNSAVAAEDARLMDEQHKAIKRAREGGSFVVMFIGNDGLKHYKASCDLTEEEIEIFKKLTAESGEIKGGSL